MHCPQLCYRELLQCLLVDAVVVDDLYLQLQVVRRASFSQTLRLQVNMVDNLKEMNDRGIHTNRLSYFTLSGKHGYNSCDSNSNN